MEWKMQLNIRQSLQIKLKIKKLKAAQETIGRIYFKVCHNNLIKYEKLKGVWMLFKLSNFFTSKKVKCRWFKLHFFEQANAIIEWRKTGEHCWFPGCQQEALEQKFFWTMTTYDCQKIVPKGASGMDKSERAQTRVRLWWNAHSDWGLRDSTAWLCPRASQLWGCSSSRSSRKERFAVIAAT